MGAMGYRLAGRFDYRGYEPDPTSYQVAATRFEELGRGEMVNGVLPADPDRHFDLLVAFEVLEHIDDDVGALASWVRWLSPTGSMIVSVPAHPRRFGPCDEMVGHCRRYTRGQLGGLIESAGFKPTIETWGMPSGYMLEAVRNRLARRRQGQQDIGTPGSGRLYQPPSRLGRFVELALRPIAALERPFRGTERGVGYVAVGRSRPPVL
jgi:SAM-dependent methyltransferase